MEAFKASHISPSMAITTTTSIIIIILLPLLLTTTTIGPRATIYNEALSGIQDSWVLLLLYHQLAL